MLSVVTGWSLVTGHWLVASGQPSVVTGQPVESLVNVNFKNDIRLFTVMAALNAAGFDHESPGKAMSAVRAALRQDLEPLDTLLRARLKSFYLEHRAGRDESQEQAVYTSLALVLSGPPQFELVVDAQVMPEDAWKVLGFEELVREFYRVARVPELWQRYESHYLAELAAYRPIFKEAIQETLRYFRTPPRIVLDRQIILIPDLLNAQGIVNARNLEEVYYVVVSPSDNPANNHTQLQHEYLHFLVDPLLEKFGADLLKHQPLLTLAHNQPSLKADHRDRFLVIVAESLIEAMLLRLHAPADLDSDFVRLFRQGLIFAPFFYRGLELYEKSDLISFPSYAETLFSEITKEKVQEEEKRIAQIEARLQLARQEEMAAQQKAQQEAEQRSLIHRLLAEAGRLISEKKYQEAGGKLQELLAEDPGNGNAFFYLAQMASQNGEHERAFEYYGQAAQSPGALVWVRAWSVLRMGRFLAFQGDFEKAGAHFRQVMAMEGDLQGAREEAHKSLRQLPLQ